MGNGGYSKISQSEAREGGREGRQSGEPQKFVFAHLRAEDVRVRDYCNGTHRVAAARGHYAS